MADSSKDEEHKENLFEIMDGIILQLNRTKKMFIIMIITVMVISPIALLITYLVFPPPFEQGEEKMRREGTGPFHRFFLRYIPPIVSVIWLGIGIRQWFVLSKWTAKYDKYKKLQEEIDKKLADQDKDSEKK